MIAFYIEKARGEVHPRPSLPRRVQHIFDKYSIPRGGIVNQNVGHRAYQPAVLNNGAAGHECVK